jgi:hypothetical protein
MPSEEKEWINHLGRLQMALIIKGEEVHDRNQQKQDQQGRA